MVRVCRLITHVLLAFIGSTGLLKLLDVAAFERSLATWNLLPTWTIDLLAFVIPIFELGLACFWFSGLARRAVLWPALTFLVAATAIYTLHVVLLEPPDCGCLGLLGDYFENRRQAPALVARNSVLAIAISVGLVTRWEPPAQDAGETSDE